jgi:hypothetical protein
MQQLYPEPEDKPEAVEGEAAHWCGAELMMARPVEVGMVAPNGHIIDEEMIEGAAVYAGHVLETLGRLGLRISDAHVEQKMPIYSVHPKNGGTPDVWAFVPGELHVWDFKFGHRFVEVFENWQLTDYAVGILHQLAVMGHAVDGWTVHFHIVQPRCYQASGPVRSWSFSAAELAPRVEVLRQAALAATLPNPPATPNPECEFCTGRHACAALQRDAYRSADHSLASAPVELPNAAIGLELRLLRRAAERLAARISGLEETALIKMQRGERIPWFAVEHGQGRTVWAKPAAEVLTLGQLFGVELAKPATLTPAQAIKAGVPAEVVKPLTATPKGAAKLVPDNGDGARRVFGGAS